MHKHIEFINFLALSEEESKLILLWRNTEKVRMWMLHESIIRQEEHNVFLKSLKQKQNESYFLVKSEKAYLGVVSFTDITETSCEIGIYANPSLKGLGELLMNLQLRYAFNTLKVKKLIVHVFDSNTKAILLYKKFNFVHISQDLYNNKTLLHMELSL